MNAYKSLHHVKEYFQMVEWCHTDGGGAYELDKVSLHFEIIPQTP